MEKIEPCTCYFVDDKAGRLGIEVRLPEVDQENITLETQRDSFCVRAPKGEGFEYSGCFVLPREIESDEAETRFEGEYLKISAPMLRSWADRIIYRPLA